MRRTRLSALQFAMLETMTTGISLSIEKAKLYDQRPFRSMLMQGWVAYYPGRGFHITDKGRKARSDFHHADIARKDPLGPLTSYFDPAAYGLAVPSKKAVVHVMRRRGAA